MYKLSNLIAWVDLCTYCNAACPLCHRTNINTLKKVDWLPLVQWSLEQFQQAFPADTLIQFKHIVLCGTWGDPIMNRDIDKIVAYIITNSKCTITINTNGSIRDPDWWWKLGIIGGKRLYVVFAVEGITQEMHSHYRQNTSLETIKYNIAALSRTQAKVTVQTLLFKHNQDYVEDIEKMVRSWGPIRKFVATPAERFDFESSIQFNNNDVIEQYDKMQVATKQ